jgi:hypothetical protein
LGEAIPYALAKAMRKRCAASFLRQRTIFRQFDRQSA